MQDQPTTQPSTSNSVTQKPHLFARLGRLLWHKQLLFYTFRLWRNAKFVAPTNHAEVIQQVWEEGRGTGRFAFMTTMSCAIAILGLLLSSPAVVIGAMLISPLMGPIVSLGFSFCIFDVEQMRKSLGAIALGILLSLAISIVIVTLSPLTDPTPEILARTKPNLFDLLVAVFSGLAGGYAVIKSRGATIVGVAIATALMPPLAVCGYGVATGIWSIAWGAGFLFMTNLLAISLSVLGLAKWYGFGWQHSSKHTLLQTAAIFITFVVLSVPLGLSLKSIAYQSLATKSVKAEINEYFHFASSRISTFSILFGKDGKINVDCVLVTNAYAPEAEKEIGEKLTKELERDVVLSLNQIVVAARQQKEANPTETKVGDTALANTPAPKATLLNPQEEIAQAIKNTAVFPLNFVKIDPEKTTAIIQPKAGKDITLALLRTVENNLAVNFPAWTISVIPPAGALPPVMFDMGGDTVSEATAETIDNILWALQRWEIYNVSAVGFASSAGEVESFDNSSLAFRRARAVATKLREAGIKVQIRAEYNRAEQKRDEKLYGLTNFHKVEIRPRGDVTLPDEVPTLQQVEEEKAN
ncbi:MAG: DUF389 domain-containing protein [Alphaproteobacteria bacterium]|nr:DUF389 domain-containing protein [Alphaproteobacteria bacterium]